MQTAAPIVCMIQMGREMQKTLITQDMKNVMEETHTNSALAAHGAGATHVQTRLVHMMETERILQQQIALVQVAHQEVAVHLATQIVATTDVAVLFVTKIVQQTIITNADMMMAPKQEHGSVMPMRVQQMCVMMEKNFPSVTIPTQTVIAATIVIMQMTTVTMEQMETYVKVMDNVQADDAIAPVKHN